MQFIYHKSSGQDILVLDGNNFLHIFKSRRTKKKEQLNFRNLLDNKLYQYEVLEINKKDAVCKLTNILIDEAQNKKNFNLAWSVVDPKIVEKTLPMLNEIGVSKISFIYTDFSQKNFKIDIERFQRILINSCEQCGRTSLMEFEIYKTLDEFSKKYNDFGVVDFSKNRLKTLTCKFPEVWLVGCEGGFSQKEKEFLKGKIIVGFDSKNILRSESAVVAISSKILL